MVQGVAVVLGIPRPRHPRVWVGADPGALFSPAMGVGRSRRTRAWEDCTSRRTCSSAAALHRCWQARPRWPSLPPRGSRPPGSPRWATIGTNSLRFRGAPGGVKGMLLLAVSHLAMHTWPERGGVPLDVYFCNFRRDNSHARRASSRHCFRRSPAKRRSATRCGATRTMSWRVWAFAVESQGTQPAQLKPPNSASGLTPCALGPLRYYNPEPHRAVIASPIFFAELVALMGRPQPTQAEEHR